MLKIKLKKMLKFILAFLIIFSIIISISYICLNSFENKNSLTSNNLENLSKEVFAMDTVMTINIYNSTNDVLDLCEEKIIELDGLFSTTNENSEISILNKYGSNTVSKDTFDLIEKSLKICTSTNGSLDISVYPLVQAWGFTTDSFKIPSNEEITNLLNYVDYKKIKLSTEENTVTLDENMQIDLGSTAKGYTSNSLIKILKDANVKSALLNLGGNVHALGAKPDNTPWRIAIKNPLNNSNALVINIIDKAVITSGAYERYFIDDNGKKYGHIIDPKTGMPIENDLLSVTIIGEDAVLCDALSTSLFVMGLDKSIEYWKENNNFDAIFITKNNDIYITEGIEDDITLIDDYSDISPNIIKNEN